MKENLTTQNSNQRTSASPKPKAFGSPSKVAWLRTGAIGDLLVGTASLKEAIEKFPHSDFQIIGPRTWLQLLTPECFPEVKELFVLKAKSSIVQCFVPDSNVSWKEFGPPQKLTEILRQTDVFINTNFDSFRYGWPALLAGVKTRYGSSQWPLAHVLYTHCLPWLGKDPEIHERDWPLTLIEASATSLLRPPPKINELRANLSHLPKQSLLVQKWHNQGGLPALKIPVAERAQQLAGSENFILLNPTSSRREKAWPSALFRELALKMRPLLGETEICIIGAPNETEWLKEVAGYEFKIIQPKSLLDAMDVIHFAKLLITNTSSMQFLSAGQNTKTLTLMGRTNAKIWGPLGRSDQFIQGTLNSKLDFHIFKQELAAYQTISVDQVLGKALEMLDEP